MAHNTKNCLEDDHLIIGGKLTFEEGAEINGMTPEKTGSQLSNIAAIQSGADAAAITTALNTLLADMKAKGMMAADQT